MKAITTTKGLTEKCYDCGIALHPLEVAYEIGGDFIDYIEHKPGEIRITLCSGCRDRILHYLHTDQGDAILKRKELEAGGAKREMAKLDFSESEEQFIESNPFGFDAPDDVNGGI